MAEAKRRSEVKKFRHRTVYPRPIQTSLFGEGLVNAGHDWVCTLNGDTVPPVGSKILVQVGPEKWLDVLWGNQVVARVTDPLGNDLADVLSGPNEGCGVMAGAIIAADDAEGQLVIKLRDRDDQESR